MTANTTRNVTIAFIVFGLVTVLLVTLISNMSVTYGKDSTEINSLTGGAFDTVEINRSLSGGSNTTAIDISSDNLRQRFESGDVDDVDDASGIFTIAGDIFGFIITPFNTLTKIIINVFGVPTIVGNVLSTIISLLLIFGAWRLLRVGD